MKILFIGGNGNISWHCVQKAIEYKHEVYVLNRGVTLQTRREIQHGVKKIDADVKDVSKMKQILQGMQFDVVCDFICYNKEDAKRDIELFYDKTKHFIVISTEAVYSRENLSVPFNEKSKIIPIQSSQGYIKGKLEIEEAFLKAVDEIGFPVTIVRPGYTYDTIVPNPVGHNCFTASQKYLDGYPMLIFGNGKNLYTFTHSEDFADAFLCLLGNRDTIGEIYQIMSEHTLSWNDAAEIILKVLNIKRSIIHIPYEEAIQYEYFQSRDMLEQKLLDNVFDITKLKTIYPSWRAKISLEEGLTKTYQWLLEKKVRQRIVPEYNQKLNILYERYCGIK